MLFKQKSFPPYALSFGYNTIGGIEFENIAGITNTALPTQNIYLLEEYFEAVVRIKITMGSLNFINGIALGGIVESITEYENFSRESFDLTDDFKFVFLNPYTKESISASFWYRESTMTTFPSYTVGQEIVALSFSWRNSAPQDFITSLQSMCDSLLEKDQLAGEGYISTEIPNGYKNTDFLIEFTNRTDSGIS